MFLVHNEDSLVTKKKNQSREVISSNIHREMAWCLVRCEVYRAVPPLLIEQDESCYNDLRDGAIRHNMQQIRISADTA
jgi:hypothetical protein